MIHGDLDTENFLLLEKKRVRCSCSCGIVRLPSELLARQVNERKAREKKNVKRELNLGKRDKQNMVFFYTTKTILKKSF